MNDIYIGKIVNTHGLKGEVRILSDFEYKEDVFKPGMILYIGPKKIPEKITHYRVHKDFDMVTFDGINDINDVLKYKGSTVYVHRDDVEIDGYINEDLIGLDVETTHKIGQVVDVLTSGAGRILVVQGKNKNMIPMVDEFIKEINVEKRIIKIEEIEGLIHED